VSSTIVDCCGAAPVILRQGAISKEAIDRALETF
jgi:tRNA A37 threonylcarbamoyladenosine synthetase subunit TsaC/SUA5/YrdC